MPFSICLDARWLRRSRKEPMRASPSTKPCALPSSDDCSWHKGEAYGTAAIPLDNCGISAVPTKRPGCLLVTDSVQKGLTGLAPSRRLMKVILYYRPCRNHGSRTARRLELYSVLSPIISIKIEW